MKFGQFYLNFEHTLRKMPTKAILQTITVRKKSFTLP